MSVDARHASELMAALGGPLPETGTDAIDTVIARWLATPTPGLWRPRARAISAS